MSTPAQQDRLAPRRHQTTSSEGTYKIGRIVGIEINIHWTWLFIFALITWTFANGILAELYPDWSTPYRWVLGAFIAIVFFSSLLLHELSHSLVARHYGIEVSSITLFVFGGVSNLTREPDSAGREFRIAIVGPLTSLAIAALFGIFAGIADFFDSGVAGVAANLAVINTAIGIFNLVPGFPLDGGRVLRSAFWARNKNLLDATRIASNIATVVAYGMMGFGLLIFFFAEPVSGIWLFLIGNFLKSTSTASYERLFVDTYLRGVPASSLARRDYIAIRPDETLQEVVDRYLIESRGPCLPVLAGEELLGLLTFSDIRAVSRENWPSVTAYRAMTAVGKLKTVHANDDLATVLALMAEGNHNQIPVLDGRLLSGLVERSDIVNYIHARETLGRPANAGPSQPTPARHVP